MSIAYGLVEPQSLRNKCMAPLHYGLPIKPVNVEEPNQRPQEIGQGIAKSCSYLVGQK